ncbi:MAG TPA: hypothetical protein DCL54_01485 [Alphaproteobacteria bacterium]|nr:hypothetical protein [Alphaproteobacteria bacterium]HAJ45238.1 hypothetical protein [Alphaproteobacteria bacterium]
MLIRQTLLYLPAQTLVPLSQLAAAVLWTFWLSHAAMGTYALIWSVQELIGLLILSWWTSYVQRYATALHADGRSAAFDALEMTIQGAASVVQSVIALLAASLLFEEPLTLSLALATLAFTVSRNVGNHFAARARAQFEALPYALNTITGSVLGLALGWIAVSQISATPEALLFAYAIAQTAGLIIGVALMKTTPQKPNVDWTMLRDSWQFGAPVMMSASLSWVGNHAIRFIVEVGLGRAAVGLMSVGWWMGMRVTQFVGLLLMGAAYNVAVERMRSGGPQAAVDQLAVNSGLLLAVLIPAAVGLLFLIAPVVTILVETSYRDVTQQILPLALATGAARVFRDHGSDAACLVFEMPRLPPMFSAVDAGATIALGSVGLWAGGVVGAAWGCLAASMLAAAVSISVAHWRFGYHVRWRDCFKISLATAVMALCLVLAPTQLSVMTLLFWIVLGAGVYTAVLAAIYPQERVKISRALEPPLSRVLRVFHKP